MEKQMCVMINGARAVELAHRFIGDFCYRGVYEHEKRLAQMEVVIDEEGDYKGKPNKWVSVIIINLNDVERTINQLCRLGFEGCLAYIAEETITGCFIEEDFLCGIIL